MKQLVEAHHHDRKEEPNCCNKQVSEILLLFLYEFSQNWTEWRAIVPFNQLAHKEAQNQHHVNEYNKPYKPKYIELRIFTRQVVSPRIKELVVLSLFWNYFTSLLFVSCRFYKLHQKIQYNFHVLVFKNLQNFFT